jgi:DNA-binding XRE family transcriptional regulator/PAS domain-containing protein
MQPFIGSRIRLYRSMAGKTQEQLSVELDVTKQHLGLIERGECNPSLDLLKKICQALGVSPATFFLGCTCRDDVCAPVECGSEVVDIDPVSACGSWVVHLDGSGMSWSESLYRFIGDPPRLKPSLKRFARQVEARFRDDFLRFYDDVVTRRKVSSFRCTVARKSGGRRAVQIKADIVPCGPEGGGLALFSFLDITDQQSFQRAQLSNQLDLENIVQEKTKSLRHTRRNSTSNWSAGPRRNACCGKRATPHGERGQLVPSSRPWTTFSHRRRVGIILHANPAAVSKTGYSLEELTAMHLLDLHEAGKHESARETCRPCCAGSAPPATCNRHPGRAGHPRGVAHLARQVERRPLHLRDLQGATPHFLHAAAAHL